MNKHQKLNEEHQAQMAGLSNPDRYTFVDLGLPSGRLWATENAPGFYTYDEAVDTFGGLLPKGSAMVELIEESTCIWNDEKKGLDITGPNGNTIFLPAAGYTWGSSAVKENEEEGNYWTRMPNSQTLARNLYFNSGGDYPLNYDYRSNGFSVRPCRELH